MLQLEPAIASIYMCCAESANSMNMQLLIYMQDGVNRIDDRIEALQGVHRATGDSRIAHARCAPLI